MDMLNEDDKMSSHPVGQVKEVEMKCKQKLSMKVTRDGKEFQFPPKYDSFDIRNIRFYLYVKWWNLTTYMIRIRKWIEQWRQS